MFAKAVTGSKLTDDALLALAWACSIGHTYLDGAREENVHGISLIALPTYDVSMVHSQKPDGACERRLRLEGQLSKETDCSYGCEDVLDILGAAFAVGALECSKRALSTYGQTFAVNGYQRAHRLRDDRTRTADFYNVEHGLADSCAAPDGTDVASSTTGGSAIHTARAKENDVEDRRELVLPVM